MLTTTEWIVLGEMVNILQPFEELTVELSAEKNVAISKVILMTEGVTKVIVKLRASVVQPKAIELCELINKKWCERFQELPTRFTLAAPTFLDPRFKAKGTYIFFLYKLYRV